MVQPVQLARVAQRRNGEGTCGRRCVTSKAAWKGIRSQGGIVAVGFACLYRNTFKQNVSCSLRLREDVSKDLLFSSGKVVSGMLYQGCWQIVRGSTCPLHRPTGTPQNHRGKATPHTTAQQLKLKCGIPIWLGVTRGNAVKFMLRFEPPKAETQHDKGFRPGKIH